MIICTPMVDWITLTTFDARLHRIWRNEDFSSSDDWAKRGTSILGYLGEMGTCGIGSLFIGTGIQRVFGVDTTHYMLRSSGELADAVAQCLLSPLPAGLESARNCKRVDVQVTVPLWDNYDARELYNVLKTHYEQSEKPSQLRIIQNGGRLSKNPLNDSGMDTVYLGSRTSTRYKRFYVKVDKDLRKYLRFEIEIKGDDAAHFRYEHMEYELQSTYRRLPQCAKNLLDPLGDVVLRPEVRKPEIVRDRERDTIAWLHNTVSTAFEKCVNNHQTRQQALDWYETLASILPKD